MRDIRGALSQCFIFSGRVIYSIFLHLKRAKYVSEITKKSLQPMGQRKERVKICIFVPVCNNSFNASRIHELKKYQEGSMPEVFAFILYFY